jgi:single-stranded DNA-binding protein
MSQSEFLKLYHHSKEQLMLQRTEIRATGHIINDKEDLIVRTIGRGRKAVKVLNFSLAVSNYAGQGTSPKERSTSFYRVSAWNKDAENLARYLSKGKPLTVIGTLELKPFTSRKYPGATLHSAEVRMRAGGFEFINSGV